ncbi:MAG: TolC family protein [Calditrichia bacterium]|nr:TolC family protein [Calditrichia bacterium]
MIQFKTVILLLIFLQVIFAQEDPLERYIQIGLESNLALKQQEFSLEQSIEMLNEARGKYFPSIDIGARYTRAGGGREIIIPIGDLVNPVYKTLNQLLIAEGLPPTFPEDVPNESIPFIREKEHETRIRLVQPLFQPAIWSNYGLKSDLNEIEQLRIRMYKRRLVNEIKRAYYNYLKATQVVDLYTRIKDLQTENLRVSEKLFSAGKATQDVVFRARAELSQTEQEQMHVENLQRQGRSYLNFILNRPLETEIIKIDRHTVQDPATLNYESALHHAFSTREEIEQIKQAISATGKNAKIVRSKYYPGINAVLDYGFQGVEYSFSKDDDFWMASLVLEWNLFRGFQDKAKLEQVYLERKKLSTKEEEIRNLIELEVERIYDNLTVTRKTIDVARQQVESARASFKIIRKKYEEGVAAQVAYLDAQTTLTNAAINEVISEYDYYITYANFERIVALYEF